MSPLIIFLLLFGGILLWMYFSNKSTKNKFTNLEKSPRISQEKIPSYQTAEKHPVLEYQRRASYGTVPATLGDPIRPFLSAGPSMYERAYTYDRYSGPYADKFLNIPVPAGSLKMSSEKYKYPFYTAYKPLKPYDYFKPYGPNQTEQMSSEIVYADTPFYKDTYTGNIPFISSVNAYSPFPEVNTPWEKIGTLTTTDLNDDSILNLYRKPIAPLQDLFEYTVQDKNGFIIPLQNINFLENGDIVKNVQGKENKGQWKANIYIKNKWVWT